MSEKIADLGAVAVLDAANLMEGQHIEIQGQLCIVDRITPDNQVFLKVVRGWPMVQHILRKFWKNNWTVVVATAVIALLIILATYFHVERLLF